MCKLGAAGCVISEGEFGLHAPEGAGVSKDDGEPAPPMIATEPDLENTAPAPAPRARWIALGVLLVITIAAYANSFRGPMVFDDIVSIVTNPSLREPSRWLAPPEVTAGVGGRPLLNLTFGLNYAAGELSPVGYHVVNLAIHLTCAAAVFGLMRRVLAGPRLAARFGGDATWVALAVATLWAVHPLQTESVTYISQRAEALWSLCLLAVLYGVVRSIEEVEPRRVVAWRILAVVACFCGMLVKETMVVAPVLAWLLDTTFFAASWREAWRVRGRFYLALASAWLVLAWSMWTSGLGERGVGYGLEVSAFSYALVQCGAILHYLRTALVPVGLVLDFGEMTEVAGFGAWYNVVPALIIIIGLLVAAWRWRVAGFAGLWLLTLLAPTSSVVPIVGQPVAEHRMYLPLLGPVALLVALAYLWRRRLALKAVGLVTLLLAGLTLMRNADYRSAESIWRDNLSKVPENPRAAGYLATALQEQGRLDEAATVLREALTLHPDYGWLHDGYSRVLLAKGDVEQALLAAQRARELMPDVMAPREQLVRVLRLAGAHDAAREEMEEVLKIMPDNAAVHVDLALTLRALGRTDDAVRHATEAVRLTPKNFRAHGALAMALLDADRVPEAVAHHWEWLRLQPGYNGINYEFAEALMNKGLLPEAEVELEDMLRRNPNDPLTLNYLGVTLAGRGQRARARTALERALQIQPDFAPARTNLEVLLATEPARRP